MRHLLRKQRFNTLLAAAAIFAPIAVWSASVGAFTITGSAPLTQADALFQAPIAPLKIGLDALAGGRIGEALEVRNGLSRDSLDHKVLSWAIAVSGGSSVPSAEIAETARALSDWPGATTMRRNNERALYRENPDASVVVHAFNGTTPLTFQGIVLLTRASVTLGKVEAAKGVLLPFWQREKLEPAQEAAILKEFGAIIPAADHRIRMERMLYAKRVKSAQRVAALAGAGKLADAWAASIRSDKQAGKLLDAVPAEQRSAGFYFAQAKMLRRQKKFAAAAAAMLKAPTEQAALADPDAWWIERRALSRELMDGGDVATAYKLVAAHAAESPVNRADAEFHAGWYALRGLKDAKAAAVHFARIAEAASGPISLSRSYYWAGRAAEAGGGGDARALYEQAAAFGTSFYGQLAASRLGRDALAVPAPATTAEDHRRFNGRDAVQAIMRLEEAGHSKLADMLYRSLADTLDQPGELALLAGMAEQRGNHYLALKVAKAAAARGLNIGALSHPMGAIPDTAEIPGAGKALAYAVARQESEFNIGAVSGAGARGLLQLLPNTARETARKAGLPFSQDRLTTDAAYNATLGAAFLDEQLKQFDGSYVLTFAGYNAGPRRAREWIKRYGDPRTADIDGVVDWIERIPFSETRAYVQRVMENYQVYKMQLSGHADIGTDLVRGR